MKTRGIFYGYIIVAASFLIMMMTMGLFNTFGVFFEPMRSEFAWSRAVASGAASINSLVLGVVCLFTARLNDKFGARRVTTACGLALGLGYILMRQVSSLGQLYLYYGLFIAVGMSAFILLTSNVARWFVKRTALMTGVVFAGIGTGTILLSPLVNQLVASYGWRSAYLYIGVVAMVVVIGAAQFLKRDPAQMGLAPYGGTAAHGADPGADGFSIREALGTRQFWLFAGLYFLFLLCLVTVLVHLVVHTTDLGYSPASAATALALMGGVSILGMGAVGALGDRLGSRRTMLMTFGLMAASFLWLAVARQMWALYFFAGVFGFAYGGTQSLFSPLVAELFGLKSHGLILAAGNLVGTIGAAIGPVVAGYVADTTGGYAAAFPIYAAACLLAVVFTVVLRPGARKSGVTSPG